MSTPYYLPPPRKEEWHDVTITKWEPKLLNINSRITFKSDGSPFTLQFDYIPIGLKVYCYVAINTAMACVLSGPNEAYTRAEGLKTTSYTFSFTGDGGPFVITISGATTGITFQNIYTYDSPSVLARPCDVLALEAWCPKDSAALKWDQGRWDRDAWNKPAITPGTFTWDHGKWDINRWYDTTDTSQWTNILGPCTQVDTVRGVTTSGPILAAQVGTLTAAAIGLNPRALGLLYGAPIRLYHWPTRTPLFTGNLSDFEITPQKGAASKVTLTAVDAVSQLANTTRYGARPDYGAKESWKQRLDRIMKSAAIPYQVGSYSDVVVCPTVWETSLAKHLDALTATTAGGWYIDRRNTVTVIGDLDLTAHLTLSDQYDPPVSAEKIWYYTAGPAAWKASSMIAAVEATTHDAIQDTATGEWKANDVTVTATNQTTQTAYGGGTVKVDVMTESDTATIQAAAERLLKRSTTAPVLSAATIRPVSKATLLADQAADMQAATELDPLTACVAIQEAETATELITQVKHTITPTTWTTDLTLNHVNPLE